MTPKQAYYERVAKTLIKNMERRQMEAYYCADRATAVQKVLELMPHGSSVAWGGSVTLTESGLMDALDPGLYNIIDRAAAKTKEEQRELYGKICGCDFFLMSTNAMTLDGELVNIDGRGNRVAFLCYGPENVIVLTGLNKVTPDLESAIQRVQNVAAPPNTIRLNCDTPCSVTGRCGDCYGPDSICSSIVITRRSHFPNRIKVVLVGEELGF
ncbi:MAG TPA: lactate utilization protein [Clostridiaceae bacterium]|nr:lactate utilization protein [Clostridiaceae bacterium]